MNFNKILERRGEILPVLQNKILRGSYHCGIVPDANGKQILAMREKHAGRRAFIIGNGPSLKASDLSLIQREITFASNKIYLIFDQTAWRPTYYSVCDRLVARNNCEVIRQLPLTKVFSEQVKEYFPGSNDITWLHETARNQSVQEYLDGKGPPVSGCFSQNPLTGLDGGWTVVYLQMQLAYYMGITELILLGMDFNFTVPENRVQTNIRGYDMQVESVGEVNHFHPDYRKPGEAWGIPRLDCMQFLYAVAQKHYLDSGRRIINASRSTKLEVFQREELEQILVRKPGGDSAEK